MKLNRALWALFFTISAYAQDPLTYVKTVKKLSSKEAQIFREKGKILIKGSSCEVLNQEAAALKLWTKKLNEKIGEAVCVCSSKTKCSVDVTEIIPKLVQEKQSVCAQSDGPNCWNAALTVNKILPALRYTSDEEMTFWMNSPLCRERGPEEKREPGDIIAIRTKGSEEVHGFIHISDNLSFSKNGNSKLSPYSLQSPAVIQDLYKVPVECRNTYKTPKDEAKCKNWSNTYTCSSMEDYLSKHPQVNKDLKEALKELQDNECKLEGEWFNKSSDAQLISFARVNLQLLIMLAEKNLETDLSPDEKFLWLGIHTQTKILIHQTYLL